MVVQSIDVIQIILKKDIIQRKIKQKHIIMAKADRGKYI